MIRNLFLAGAIIFASTASFSDAVEQTKGSFKDKFRQLDENLPTANAYRTAGGQPGHAAGTVG